MRNKQLPKILTNFFLIRYLYQLHHEYGSPKSGRIINTSCPSPTIGKTTHGKIHLTCSSTEFYSHNERIKKLKSGSLYEMATINNPSNQFNRTLSIFKWETCEVKSYHWPLTYFQQKKWSFIMILLYSPDMYLWGCLICKTDNINSCP